MKPVDTTHVVRELQGLVSRLDDYYAANDDQWKRRHESHVLKYGGCLQHMLGSERASIIAASGNSVTTDYLRVLYDDLRWSIGCGEVPDRERANRLRSWLDKIVYAENMRRDDIFRRLSADMGVGDGASTAAPLNSASNESKAKPRKPRKLKWECLHSLIVKHADNPEMSDQKIANLHNANCGKKIAADKSHKATAKTVKDVRHRYGKPHSK